LVIAGSSGGELGVSINLSIGIKAKLSGPAFQDLLYKSQTNDFWAIVDII
jgi:hypothetical protein